MLTSNHLYAYSLNMAVQHVAVQQFLMKEHFEYIW